MNSIPENTSLSIFQFTSAEVRTVSINNEPWFIASDVCAILDIQNSRDAVNRLEDYEKGVVTTDTPGGKQQVLCVNESGLYSLIFTSRKAEAKAFRKWVTTEVLPSIRKTGRYELLSRLPQSLPEPKYPGYDGLDWSYTRDAENAIQQLLERNVDILDLIEKAKKRGISTSDLKDITATLRPIADELKPLKAALQATRTALKENIDTDYDIRHENRQYLEAIQTLI